MRLLKYASFCLFKLYSRFLFYEKLLEAKIRMRFNVSVFVCTFDDSFR